MPPKLPHQFIPIPQCHKCPFPAGVISSLHLDTFQILSAFRKMTTQQRKKILPLTNIKKNSLLHLWTLVLRTLKRLTHSNSTRKRLQEFPGTSGANATADSSPPATHPHLIEDSLSSQDIVSFLRVFLCIFQCPLGLSRSRQSHHQNHLQVNRTKNTMKHQ